MKLCALQAAVTESAGTQPFAMRHLLKRALRQALRIGLALCDLFAMHHRLRFPVDLRPPIVCVVPCGLAIAQAFRLERPRQHLIVSVERLLSVVVRSTLGLLEQLQAIEYVPTSHSVMHPVLKTFRPQPAQIECAEV